MSHTHEPSEVVIRILVSESEGEKMTPGLDMSHSWDFFIGLEKEECDELTSEFNIGE